MSEGTERFGASDLNGLDSLVSDLQTLLDTFTEDARSRGIELELGTVLVGGSVGADRGRPGESDLDLGIGLRAPDDADVADHEQAAYDFGVFVHNHQSALAAASDPKVSYVDANGYMECEVRMMTETTSNDGGYPMYYDARQRGYVGLVG